MDELTRKITEMPRSDPRRKQLIDELMKLGKQAAALKKLTASKAAHIDVIDLDILGIKHAL
jgi:hypothetical protein